MAEGSNSGDAVTHFVFFVLYMILLGISLYFLIELKYIQKQVELTQSEIEMSPPGTMYPNSELQMVSE